MKQTLPKVTSAIVYSCDARLFPRMQTDEQAEKMDALVASFELLEVVDPLPSRWDSIGFAKMPTNDYYAYSGTHFTFCVQLNERKLPAKVRDELVQKKAADLERMQGRRVSKKEYRLLVEEAETELLPKAFIGRTKVLISITDQDKLVVWTSSAKRADRVVTLLTDLLAEAKYDPEFSGISYNRVPTDVFTRILKDNPGPDDTLVAGYSCVLKAPKASDAPTIRVRNRDLDSADIQKLAASGEDYQVTEIELLFDEGGNFSTIDRTVGCTFTVNEGLIFKKITVPGVTLERGADAVDGFDSNLFLTLSMLLKAHAALARELGDREPLYDDEDDI